MQNEILNTTLEAVGENIGHELGAKMVKDFQDNNPNETPWFYIGKNILNQIINQPDCAGIRFYNALEETGEKTLVLVGIDSDGNVIDEYRTIDSEGKLNKTAGIVADRIGKPGTKTTETTTTTLDWWA